MRYLIVYIYILLSGVAVPYALQAHDLIGREYLILAGEITAGSLLSDFLIIATFAFILLAIARGAARLLFQRKRDLLRMSDSCTLAIAGFASASLALMDHKQVYGNTWDMGGAFMTFVAPAWPALLAIIVVGAYLGARLSKAPPDA